MTYVIGIDPGLSGALASYNDYGGDTPHIEIIDMPVYEMQVGKTKRARLDAPAIRDYFEMAKLLGCELALFEGVGGRPRQSAPAAFVFGYSTGQLYQQCVASRIPVETVNAGSWKATLKVTGKKSNNSGDEIVKRADELLPMHSHLWRGPQGGLKIDRAEAAMLALYAARYAVKAIRPDADVRIAYRYKDLGA